jgi:Arc/MetJ family transcription regulator
VIFRAVGEGKPYPEHGLSTKDWTKIPPRQVRLDELVTIKKVLELETLLAEDSTFYGDLFPHAVQWGGRIYLEDGLHRAGAGLTPTGLSPRRRGRRGPRHRPAGVRAG